jgi:hypothetical protein
MGPLPKPPDRPHADCTKERVSWVSDITPEAIERLKATAGETLQKHEWEVVEGEPDS